MSQSQPEYRLDGETALSEVRNGALLIDVRSEAGRQRSGELQGAVVISKADVVEVVTKRIGRASPEQKIVVFCGSIKGSQPIVEELRAAGVKHVFDVDGGFGALNVENGLAQIERPVPAAT